MTLRLLLCLAAVLVLAPHPAAAGTSPRQPDWVYLGPIGPGAFSQIAVAPEWPRAGIILARRDRDLVRSTDGGATWAQLMAPAPELAALTLSPEWQGRRVAFAIGSETLQGPQSLYRSDDGGTTWQLAIGELSPYVRRFRAQPIVLAPTFAADGLVLFVADGTLFRSDDGGASWTDVTPPEQVVQQALFSPNYARDGRIYLATSGGSFPDVLLNTRRPATGAFDQAAGVMISTDGGISWEASNTGLQRDEVSYRNLQALAISPTFAQDGTLLAYAWGERLDEDGVPALTNERFLVRSRNAGATWEAVDAFPTGGPIRFMSPSSGFSATAPQFALSPGFDEDGVALLAVAGSGGTPTSGACSVFRTVDAGATWQQIVSRTGEVSCFSPQIFAIAGERYEVVFLGGSVNLWQRIRDGEIQRDDYFAPADVFTANSLVVTQQPRGQQTALIGTAFRGIRAFGVGLMDTEGRVPCPATTILGFDRVWQASRSVRRELGCPTEPEHPVLLWEQHLPDGRPAYGLGDNGVLRWYELTPAGFYPTDPPVGDVSGRVSRMVSDQSPWPNGEQRMVHGVMQQFEGGEMLWLPGEDGTRTIVVLGNSRYWLLPDQP